ncbi:oligosaccharide flippase family protein [Citrobacter freundii]|uniref:lipopolysaccharide biosynthesis protein n=1 Tax=Citrobacter freundii TaxID=546 RepID=UPI0015E92C6D|nr:oligosaccharide flippase family protein [Citrobacter freundii]QLR72577.1 oligosaccharide flippase family protein [Citrobacter freundii]QLY51798.1 oligosaccharide flippase family protein [Citrobacter freundii]
MKKNFINNIVIYMTGSLAAQILSFAFMPLVTRLYSPESLGVLNKFISVANVAIPLCTLSLIYSLVLTKNLMEAIKGILTIISISTVATYLVILLFLGVKTFDRNLLYWLILPLYIFLFSISQTGEQLCVKTEKFKIISFANFIQSGVNNFFKIILPIFCSSGFLLLLISAVAGVFSTFLIYYKDIFVFKIKGVIRLSNALKVIHDNKSFVFYQTPQNVINALSQGLPIFIISILFGDNMAGQYGLANTLMLVPISLLGTAIVNVTYPKVKYIYEQKGDLFIYLLKSYLTMLLISVVIFLPILLFGSEVFSFFFGGQWSAAGKIASLLVPSFVIILISRPVIPIIYIYRMQRHLLINEIVGIILKCIALGSGYYFFKSVFISVLLFSFANVAVYSILCAQALLRANRVSRKIIYKKKDKCGL